MSPQVSIFSIFAKTVVDQHASVFARISNPNGEAAQRNGANCWLVRPVAGNTLQWLGDTDRDTTQEYLFRFGEADVIPLIADMNGDGIDDVIVVDTTTTSNLREWHVRYGVDFGE